MKSLDFFNPVTSDTFLYMFYQKLIDTVACIFRCAAENRKSVEDTALVLLCMQSEGTCFHHFLFLWGTGLFFVLLLFLRGK